MNSVPNIDLEQCTGSSAQCAHTHGPGCAHIARWAGRIMAHQALCRSARPAVSHSMPRAPCRHTPVRAAARITAPCVVSWRFLHCIVALPPAVSRLSRVTTQRPSLLSRYKRLYRDTPQQPGRSPVMIQLIVSRHTPTSQAARPCTRSVVSWPILGVSWPPQHAPLGRIVAWCPCCVTIQCIVS